MVSLSLITRYHFVLISPSDSSFLVWLVCITGPISSAPILIGGFGGVGSGPSVLFLLSLLIFVADYVLLAHPDRLFAVFIGCLPSDCPVLGWCGCIGIRRSWVRHWWVVLFSHCWWWAFCWSHSAIPFWSLLRGVFSPVWPFHTFGLISSALIPIGEFKSVLLGLGEWPYCLDWFS